MVKNSKNSCKQRDLYTILINIIWKKKEKEKDLSNRMKFA